MRILLFIWRYLPPPFHWLLTHLLNPHFLVGLVAVVLDRKEGGEPRVLLFEHTYRRKIPWGLPTGWLKRGERAKEAIVREIHEESGLRAEVEGVLTVESALPYGRVDLVFRCRIVGGEFRPSPEVSQARYFPLDDLPLLLPEQEAAIALALAGDLRDVPTT